MSLLDLIMGPRPNPTGMSPQQQRQAVAGNRMMPAPISRGTPSFVAGRDAAPAQQPSMLSQIGGGIKDYLSDPINRKQLALGFNAMRLNPDANFARSLESQISKEQDMRLLNQQGNRTAEALKAAAGREPDPKKKERLLSAALLVERNPSMAKEAASLLFGANTFANKGFAPQVDPATGQMFGVQYDPNTGSYNRVDISGATGETPAQKAEREARVEIDLQDRKAAQNAGLRAFSQVENANEAINTMYTAINAVDAGGRSGAIDQFLPAFSASTQMLRNAATTMGIQVINSATFGALSAAELDLALSKGIPLGLDGPELKEHLYKKIDAQNRLRTIMLKTAQELSAGDVRYSDFIKKYEINDDSENGQGRARAGGSASGGAANPENAAPSGVDPALWDTLSPEQKEQYNALGDK